MDIQLIRTDHEDPQANEAAHAVLRITVTTADPAKVGRLFDAKVIELALAAVPGNAGRGGAGFNGGRATIHWPGGHRQPLRHGTGALRRRRHGGGADAKAGLAGDLLSANRRSKSAQPPGGEAVKLPLGRLFGTRSGDKGGNANCGVWARSDAAYRFLHQYLTAAEFSGCCRTWRPTTWNAMNCQTCGR